MVEKTNDDKIAGLLAELASWPGTPLKRHNEAGHLLHKLVFIADSGLQICDPRVANIAEKILQNQSAEGAFQVLVNISPSHGGTGTDSLAWFLCDAPSILYALLKLGLKDDPRVKAAAKHLAGLCADFGWPCAVSPQLGKFRGPGRKTDPCPYATLTSLKALAQLPEYRDSEVCRNGAEAILALWVQRKERKPYLFAMGTDFAKLKAPLVWYDILYVLEVLTQFPWLHGDPRLHEMLAILESKADNKGRFTAGSVWKAWSDWDFGQKKEPSIYVTEIAKRILARVKD
jgi:hypothetical protein